MKSDNFRGPGSGGKAPFSTSIPVIHTPTPTGLWREGEKLCYGPGHHDLIRIRTG